jgi:D-3-phosphoglycerate dehydrogenase / 2-oxoglutarate reductase
MRRKPCKPQEPQKAKLMRRVVIIDDGYANYDVERAIVGSIGARLELSPCRGDQATVAGAIRNADAVLVRESPINAAAIAGASHLAGIVRYGIGVDNIDQVAATDRRIYVANVPDYGTEDVSDHAMALLLAVARRVSTRDAFVRSGGWNSGSREKIYRIAGKTLGLIGYGRIARAFERKMRGFGVTRVLVYDPHANVPPGVESVDIDTLCRESDYLSLHAPLTPDTRHMLADRQIALMKRTAILVNTSRGALIDEAALTRALSENRIFGAGLDVFETEPPDHTNLLLKLPNTVLSDHAGWYSEESVTDLQRKAAEEIVRILSGHEPINWINRWSKSAAA